MTDYNDGNWHGWNGGKCPVHPMSEVEAIYLCDGSPPKGSPVADLAREFDWEGFGACELVVFRVVKVHREPREWWVRIDQYGSAAFSSPNLGALPPGTDMASVIKVREVIE